jgi:hypothetical protein
MTQKLTQQDIDRLLALEAEVKKKKAKEKEYARRREAMRTLYQTKAMDQGIVVTEKEIDEYLANR